MEILNHHIQILTKKIGANVRVGLGSSPDHAYWEKGIFQVRWGHIDLATGRVTEFRHELGRHVMVDYGPQAPTRAPEGPAPYLG